MYCVPVLSPYSTLPPSSLTDLTAAKDKHSPLILDRKPEDYAVHSDGLSRRNGSAENTSVAFCQKDCNRTLSEGSDFSLDLNSDTNHSVSDQSNAIDAENGIENGPSTNTTGEEITIPKSLHKQDELVESLKNHEFHESLHLKMNVADNGISTANGSIPIGIPPEPHECSDEHFSLTPQTHPPASKIEIRPIGKQSTSDIHSEGMRVSGTNLKDESKAESISHINGIIPVFQRDGILRATL